MDERFVGLLRRVFGDNPFSATLLKVGGRINGTQGSTIFVNALAGLVLIRIGESFTLLVRVPDATLEAFLGAVPAVLREAGHEIDIVPTNADLHKEPPIAAQNAPSPN